MSVDSTHSPDGREPHFDGEGGKYPYENHMGAKYSTQTPYAEEYYEHDSDSYYGDKKGQGSGKYPYGYSKYNAQHSDDDGERELFAMEDPTSVTPHSSMEPSTKSSTSASTSASASASGTAYPTKAPNRKDLEDNGDHVEDKNHDTEPNFSSASSMVAGVGLLVPFMMAVLA